MPDSNDASLGPLKKGNAHENEALRTTPDERANGHALVPVDVHCATSTAPDPATPKPTQATASLVPQEASIQPSKNPTDERRKQSDLSGQHSSSGAVATEDARPLDGAQIPRATNHGKEVAFVEPQKRTVGPGSGPPEAQTPTAAPLTEAESKEHVPNVETMEVDESSRMGDLTRLTALRPPPVDSSRPTDVLSSPGSTAQTATTPAVHDASPDTSPDNEGPHFPGDDDDDESEDHKQPQVNRGETSQHSEGVVAVDALDSSASRAASAQLLRESAKVASSKRTHLSDAPCSPKNQGHDSQESQSTISLAGVDKAANEGLSTSAIQAEEVRSDSQISSQTSQAPVLPATRPVNSTAGMTNIEAPIPMQAVQEPTPGASSSTPATHAVVDTAESQPQDAGVATPKDVTASPRPGSAQHEQAIVRLESRKRFLKEKRGLKHRRASTVMFEKPPRKRDDTIVATQAQNRSFRIPTDDYFVPLFFDGFTRQSTWMKSPEQLLGNTHKTLSSSDCQIVLQENQACKVLRRIYHLQQNDKWSLRQPKRCPEPTRQATSWDTLLQEMSWMRSDFREERKWKRAAARNLAEACATWVACSIDERKYLQVKATIPPRVETHTADENALQTSDHDGLPTPMPDLVHSDDAESPMDIDEEPQEWKNDTVAPSAIFALHDDEVVFPLQRTAAADSLLEELPLYGAPLRNTKADSAVPDFDPDAAWRRPALPLTKYVGGELVLKPAGPRAKQSRFKYVEEDEEDEFEVAGSRTDEDATKPLPPENADVALFRPEMKSIRDRLHAGHQFRPPTESLMPSQTFYENRLPSAWTAAEDEELRRQVREYSYNWSLISKNVSSNSLFISAEDRRTPWECFERWVQLEGFPNDVARTQYFQTYQRRIDSAQRAIAQANENARPQVAANGTVTNMQRRRPTLPIRVERKPLKRHFSTIDAMKKLAKKREATAAKQQQTVNNQNRRTSTENTQQKLPTKTPEDYSRMRHEREKQMHEKLLRFTQQQAEVQRQVSIF